jgi:hypothetical protein
MTNKSDSRNRTQVDAISAERRLPLHVQRILLQLHQDTLGNSRLPTPPGPRRNEAKVIICKWTI